MIEPKNIHCLALNYPGVGAGNEAPLYFVKSSSAFCRNGARIKYPEKSGKLWTEVELAIVITKDCFNISEYEAPDFIEGVTIAADLTCENIHERDHHLGFSKSRENFCPVSENLIRLDDQINDTGLEMETIINGSRTQIGNTRDMRFNISQSLAYVSSITNLRRGDILLTGTPAGVENNLIAAGDIVEHRIERLGVLRYEIY